MKKYFLILLFVVSLPVNLLSQNFYDVDYIREIKLYFNQPNWDHLLDSLYLDGLEERLLASVEIDGTMYLTYRDDDESSIIKIDTLGNWSSIHSDSTTEFTHIEHSQNKLYIITHLIQTMQDLKVEGLIITVEQLA